MMEEGARSRCVPNKINEKNLSLSGAIQGNSLLPGLMVTKLT